MTVTPDEYDLPDDEQEAAPTEQQTGKGLRAKYEAQLALNKAQAERISALESEQRTRSIAELAKAAGLPDAVAGRYPAEFEATPERFNPWAEAEKTYAQQLLGNQAAPAEQAASTTQPAPPQGVSPADQLAAARIEAQAAGAQQQVDGLEGMLARLQDRSVDWPTLQREMEAMGFRNP